MKTNKTANPADKFVCVYVDDDGRGLARDVLIIKDRATLLGDLANGYVYKEIYKLGAKVKTCVTIIE